MHVENITYVIFRLFKKQDSTDNESTLLKEISKRKVQLFIPKVNKTFWFQKNISFINKN